MSDFQLMFDVEDFKLPAKGWHVVKIKSATIKTADKTKNPDSPNDKNFIVEMVVDENSQDDGGTITKYFPHITPTGFGLKQLGALLVVSGAVKPEKIKGVDFFDTPAFETEFQTRLIGRKLGVFIDHQAGNQKRDDASIMYFPNIKKYRTEKEAVALMGGPNVSSIKPKLDSSGASLQAMLGISPWPKRKGD